MTGELEPGPESLADHKRVFSPSLVGILAEETPVPFSPRKRGHVSCPNKERIRRQNTIQGFMGEGGEIFLAGFQVEGRDALCFSVIKHNFQVFFFRVLEIAGRV